MLLNNVGEFDGIGFVLFMVWLGNVYLFGVIYDGVGINFLLFFEIVEKVELCLIDEDGVELWILFDEVDGYVWYVYLLNIIFG